MAIVLKSSPGANGNNSFEATGALNACCGDEAQQADCFYYAKLVDYNGVPATGIVIGGTTYWFAIPVTIGTTQAALDGLKNAIRAALNEAGYTNKDVEVSSSQVSDVDILIGRSAVAITEIITTNSNETFTAGCEDYQAEITITVSDIPYGGEDVDLQLFDNELGAGTPLQRVTGDGSGLVTFTNLQANKTYWVNCILTETDTPTISAVECADTPVLKSFSTNPVGVITYSDDWATDAEYPVTVTLIP